MIPLTGYSDRLSAAPGERIAFKVSSAAAGPYRARLARIIHADPNPAGPGLKSEDLAHRFAIGAGHHDGARGRAQRGVRPVELEGHGPSFIVVPEELLSHLATVSGEKPARLLRADMTYAELPGGGAVFAVGSITFCGSLSHDRYDNNVSRILRNVLDRFRARR